MGTLFYGSNEFAINVDDRALAHLQLVIVTKLRRGESFQFSWKENGFDSQDQGAVWISSAIPLRFAFAGDERFPVNREWVERLVSLVNRVGTLQLLPEPLAPPAV